MISPLERGSRWVGQAGRRLCEEKKKDTYLMNDDHLRAHGIIYLTLTVHRTVHCI